MACGCEGSCPACWLGEITDHRCGHCGRTYCPKCHGIKTGFNSLKVLRCSCAAVVRVWSDDEILEMWPQTEGELANYQKVLEVRAEITAAQLGMALQLARNEFKRMQGSK